MFHLVLGSLVEIRIGFYWLIPVTEDDPAYNPPYRFKVMERVIVEGPGWIILDGKKRYRRDLSSFAIKSSVP